MTGRSNAASGSGGGLEIVEGVLQASDTSMARVIYFDADTNSSGDVTVGLKGNPPVFETTIHTYVGSIVYIFLGAPKSGLKRVNGDVYEVTGNFLVIGTS